MISEKSALVAGYDFFGYTRRIARAFRSLGWKTDVLDCPNPLRYEGLLDRIRYRGLPERLGYEGYLQEEWKRVRQVVEERIAATECRLLFFINPVFLTGPMLERIRQRKRGAIIASWLMDPLRRLPTLRDTLPTMDNVFIYDKGDLEEVSTLNVKSSVLLNAADPTEFFPGERGNANSRWKLSFVGAMSLERLDLLERLCDSENLGPGDVRFVGGRSHILPVVGKPRMLARSWLYRKGMIDLTTVDPSGAREIYWRSEVCLNVHQRGTTMGYNPRLFEIAGSGGFQMVDRLPGVGAVLEDEQEVVTFGGTEELVEKVRRFRKDEPERKRIARNAARRVAAEHSYRHRIETVLSTCGLV